MSFSLSTGSGSPATPARRENRTFLVNRFWSLEVSGLRATQDSLSEEKENSPQATQKKKKKILTALPLPRELVSVLCHTYYRRYTKNLSTPTLASWSGPNPWFFCLLDLHRIRENTLVSSFATQNTVPRLAVLAPPGSLLAMQKATELKSALNEVPTWFVYTLTCEKHSPHLPGMKNTFRTKRQNLHLPRRE